MRVPRLVHSFEAITVFIFIVSLMSVNIKRIRAYVVIDGSLLQREV